MNPIRLFYYVSPQSTQGKLLTADKPSVLQLLLFYVLPLSLLPCVMMYMRLYNSYPQLFFDNLPGNRLLVVSIELLVLQLVVVLTMAWITQNLAEMVNIKPNYRDSLLMMALATTPLWLTSLFYIVPNLSFNVLVHAGAVLASVLLVYRGVRYIFGIRERGALITLTMAIVCTAGLGFAVILIGSLISWETIEQIQFALKKM